MSLANHDQSEFWNGPAGAIWVKEQSRIDSHIRPHGVLALRSLAPQTGERIADIGCGCGDTTLNLAEAVGDTGRVDGFDISGPMLDWARVRSANRTNVSFTQADVQIHPFEPGMHDAAFSRFGVMFFQDPVAAFINVKRSLKRGGRLSFVCWQAPERNEWVSTPLSVAARFVPVPPSSKNDPGPFAFASKERLAGILGDAGFRFEIRPEAVPMDLGPLDEAVDYLLEVGPTARALRDADPTGALRTQVGEEIRNAISGREQDGRVVLDSHVWVVEAVTG